MIPELDLFGEQIPNWDTDRYEPAWVAKMNRMIACGAKHATAEIVKRGAEETEHQWVERLTRIRATGIPEYPHRPVFYVYRASGLVDIKSPRNMLPGDDPWIKSGPR